MVRLSVRSPSVRSIMLAALREESHDVALLSDVFRCWAHGPSRAEQILMNFLAKQGGAASSPQLAALYMERPWMRGTIACLRDFCEKSDALQYLPRSPGTTARIALATMPAPFVACMPEDECCEIYTPHFLSRRNLNARCEGCLGACPRAASQDVGRTGQTRFRSPPLMSSRLPFPRLTVHSIHYQQTSLNEEP